MSAREKPPSSDFAHRFPGRFASALSDARGAIAGVVASSSNGAGGLLDVESLTRLHEIFRLRIELELEVAAVLWHTAEVVCAMADATEALNRRRAPDSPPGEWLPGAPRDEVGARRARLALRRHQERGPARWPDVEAPSEIEIASNGHPGRAVVPAPGRRADAA